MNTLSHIAAIIAVGWLVVWLFTTLNQPILGAALVVVWAWLVPQTWLAILEDREILSAGR